MFGPAHDDFEDTATERLADPRYHGSATTPYEYAIESIRDPAAYLVDGYQLSRMAMPPYTHLSHDDVAALAHFLLSTPPSDTRR